MAEPNRGMASGGRSTFPLFPHEEQIWCLDLYEHGDLNGQDADCIEKHSRIADSTCTKYKDPGLKYTQCCSQAGKLDRQTGFCAFNVPANFNDKLSSWSFYRSHRRRSG